MAEAAFGQPLTLTEISTLKRVIDGMNNKAIARQDRCGRTAVTTRLWRVRVKLGAVNDMQAAMMAYRRGYLG